MALAEAMKKKFKLEKKKRAYAISNINNPAVKVATQILARKVMRKCHVYEMHALVIVLETQCTKVVQFNWMNYLCGEFLSNCREAEEQAKTFHYVWLLLSIVLMAWELPRR